MRIIVKVCGVSPDETWKYQDFSYSCIEYNDSYRYTCISEGEWCTFKTPNSIHTHLAFVSAGITPDTKEHFLKLLENKLDSEFAGQMPSITQLKTAASEIRKCLTPSLKNICFRYFLFSDPYFGKCVTNSPPDIQHDFEEFKYDCRLNESW